MHSMVRPEEFGKEHGLIHEVIVTGRKVGAGREFWARLAHDEPLFARLIEAAMKADPSVFRAAVSQLQLAPFEAVLSRRLGQDVEVSSMPESFTDENLARWAGFNLRPVFLPEMELTRNLELPNWIKPSDWFYDQIDKGEVEDEAVQIRGGWYLADFTAGADYTDGTQVYVDDPLAPVITRLREEGKVGGYDKTPAGSRFAISWEEWQEQVLPALADELGVDRGQLRLERAVEFNAIGNIYDGNRGQFNSWEWFQEQFGSEYRLIGGDREYGGLADVYYGWLGGRFGLIAARPLVSFCPPQAD